jgi:hypothetical protein
MRKRNASAYLGTVFAGILLAACGGQPEDVPPPRVSPDPAAIGPVATPGTPVPAPEPTINMPDTIRPTVSEMLRCEPVPRMPAAGRASPYDSAMVSLGGRELKACYGRPAARGRTMIGGEAVPYGRLWRTGANEPTILHLPFRARIAGMTVEPGSYSLYTIPGEREWSVIVNRSTTQWGHESSYTDAVRAQEVGRAMVPVEQTAQHVESFTIRPEPTGANAAHLVLEWERSRIRVPVERVM